MKKTSLIWLTILMVAIVSVNLMSCGDDDDVINNDSYSDTTASSIIGTWKNAWGDGPREYTAYSFFDDGTGLMFDKGNGAERFNYTYNAQKRIVNIEYNEYETEQITISSITSRSLTMDGDEYKKTELTYDMIILGEWLLHVDVRNTFDKTTRVVFSADWDVEGTGTYEAKDYYHSDVDDEYDYSFYGLSGKVSGTWSITGDRISIKGKSQIAGDYIIDGLVPNGIRFIRASYPDEYPYLLGGWKD